MTDPKINTTSIVESVEQLAQETEAALLSGEGAGVLDKLLARAEALRGECRGQLRELKAQQGADVKKQCGQLRWSLSRLGSLRKRLRNDVLDARLYERCAEVLGSRASVRALDALIMLLIFGIIGMLIVEFGWGDQLSPATLVAFVWIDTGICVIFLAEFFFKLACSPSKAWYFKGHWIDFVASIPLAGIARWGLRWGRLARVARLARLARFVRVIRALWFLYSRVAKSVEKNRRVLDQDYEISLDGVRRFLEGLGQRDGAQAGEYGELVKAIVGEIENSLLLRTLDRITRVFRRRRPEAKLGAAGLERRRLGAGSRLAKIIARVQALLTYICDFNGIVTTPQLLNYLGQAMFKAGKRRGIVLFAVGAMGALFGLVVQQIFGPQIARLKPRTIDVAPEPAPAPARLDLGKAVCLQRAPKMRVRLAHHGPKGGPAVAVLSVTLRDGNVFALEKVPKPRTTIKPGKRVTFALRFKPSVPGVCDDVLRIRTDSGPLIEIPVTGVGVDYFALRLARRARQSFGWNFVLISLPFLGLALVGWSWARKSRRVTSDYKNVAEASFLNLMEDAKKPTMFADLAWFYDEVLLDETVLQNGAAAVERMEADFTAKVNRLLEERRRTDPGFAVEDLAYERALFPTDSRGGVFTSRELSMTRLGFVLEAIHVIARGFPPSSIHHPNGATVVQLYRDAIDGALFHETDCKTIEQLLGNITVRRVLRQIRYSPKDMKRLARLAAPFGPNLWLTFICRSIAEQTGRLVSDFNASAVPLRDVGDGAIRGDAELWRQYDAWLRGGPPVRGDNYFTNDFNAMHFLVVDEGQDERVREQFGDRVLAKLRHERSRMVRTIFGTYALSQTITINPYRLYHRVFGRDVQTEMHMGRLQRALGVPKGVFKIVGLPLRMVCWSFRGALAAARWGKEFILNVLADVETEQEKADFDACLRKITRMRGPVIAEASAIRARFDAAYLGCLEPEAGPSRCVEDMASVHAGEETILFYKRLRKEWGAELDELAAFMERDPELECQGEALRAVQTAYLLDDRGLKRLVQAVPTIEAVERSIAEGRVVWPKGGWRKSLRQAIRAAVALGRDDVSVGLDRFSELYGLEPGPATQRLRRAYVRGVDGLREAVDTFVWAGGKPREKAKEMLEEIIAGRHREWTAELVTVRTLHALSLLDRRNYELAVYDVGGFADMGARLPERRRIVTTILDGQPAMSQ